MSTKYDSIFLCDDGMREYYNQIDELVSKVGLDTQIAPNSNDNLLQILKDGKCICTVGGQFRSALYNPHPEILALRDDIMDVGVRIPFVSDTELEEQRLEALEEPNQSEMEMIL